MPQLPNPKNNDDEVLDLDKIGVHQGFAEVVSVSDVGRAAEALKGISRLVENFNFQLPSIRSHILDTPTMTSFAIPPNPAHETNRLLREVSAKLDNLSEQNAKLVAPRFYPDTCEIIFANQRIKVPKDTNQEQLCKALFSDPGKEWDWSEMLEAWGYDETGYDKDSWRKVYMAARAINTKVAVETPIKDMLAITKKTVAINPAYLGQIS